MGTAKDLLDKLVEENTGIRKYADSENIYVIEPITIYVDKYEGVEISSDKSTKIVCGNVKRFEDFFDNISTGKFVLFPVEFIYNDEYYNKELGVPEVYNTLIEAYRSKLVEDLLVLRNYEQYTEYGYSLTLTEKKDIEEEIKNMKDEEVIMYVDMLDKLNINQSIIVEV